mmetsp:Transcript_27633/g.65593  ORF Transcript_27633/g.65593 Transcript_27633/m.65593 type:complete len:324 (+) Transcript_27633:1256-2227(+)
MARIRGALRCPLGISCVEGVGGQCRHPANRLFPHSGGQREAAVAEELRADPHPEPKAGAPGGGSEVAPPACLQERGKQRPDCRGRRVLLVRECLCRHRQGNHPGQGLECEGRQPVSCGIAAGVQPQDQLPDHLSPGLGRQGLQPRAAQRRGARSSALGSVHGSLRDVWITVADSCCHEADGDDRFAADSLASIGPGASGGGGRCRRARAAPSACAREQRLPEHSAGSGVTLQGPSSVPPGDEAWRLEAATSAALGRGLDSRSLWIGSPEAGRDDGAELRPPRGCQGRLQRAEAREADAGDEVGRLHRLPPPSSCSPSASSVTD